MGSAHSADAGMEGGPLGADQVGQHHVQDGGRRPAGDRPEHIVPGGGGGGSVRPQEDEQRAAEQGGQDGEQRPADEGAPEAEGRAPPHSVIVPGAQRPAHHAGRADSEQVVHRIEGQQHRRGQGDSGVLDGVVEPPHEVGVGQVVEDHHKRAEYRGDGQGDHRPGNGRPLKQLCLFLVYHGNDLTFSFLRSISHFSRNGNHLLGEN